MRMNRLARRNYHSTTSSKSFKTQAFADRSSMRSWSTLWKSRWRLMCNVPTAISCRRWVDRVIGAISKVVGGYIKRCSSRDLAQSSQIGCAGRKSSEDSCRMTSQLYDQSLLAAFAKTLASGKKCGVGAGFPASAATDKVHGYDGKVMERLTYCMMCLEIAWMSRRTLAVH